MISFRDPNFCQYFWLSNTCFGLQWGI